MLLIILAIIFLAKSRKVFKFPFKIFNNVFKIRCRKNCRILYIWMSGFFLLCNNKFWVIIWRVACTSSVMFHWMRIIWKQYLILSKVTNPFEFSLEVLPIEALNLLSQMLIAIMKMNSHEKKRYFNYIFHNDEYLMKLVFFSENCLRNSVNKYFLCDSNQEIYAYMFVLVRFVHPKSYYPVYERE